MLRINRLRVEINTANGVYGIDETFGNGMNFVASSENTCGKSSILAAIYYCLGFEQIIGGVGGIGRKVLTSVFKTSIDDAGKTWAVTESGAYLEISNGYETVTIFRNIILENKDDRLITVFFSDYNSIGNPKTQAIDFYVNIRDAATSERGFHAFLEEFLHLELPLVRTSDGNERKLYLQVIFSSMFIEQKHGWSDILSGMPIFGIRESKKRVVEFILNLETIKHEKERDRLKVVKAKLERDWEFLIADLQRIVSREGCYITNLPLNPRVLSDNDYSRITITVGGESTVDDEVARLQGVYDSLRQLKPRVHDNFESLSTELSETESVILSQEAALRGIEEKFSYERCVIVRLENDLEIVNADIRNNNDAARLQKFGSESTGEFSADICPVCKQQIQDNLLSVVADNVFMNIEDNITHLKEQKKMLEYSLSSHKDSKDALQREQQSIEARLLTLRRLAQTIRSDLYTTTDTEASEAIMLKRIEMSRRIEKLSELRETVSSLIETLKELSAKWNEYLDQNRRLPKSDLSESDAGKINLLKRKFVENLKLYHYSSLSNLDGIDIAPESLLPTIDGFDMKFDSSASDGIRVIWAFTMALLQVSIEKEGNHSGVIIFDEPAQQSIVPDDMDSFINSAVRLGKNCQIITAITLNSKELVGIIDGLDSKDYHKITIHDKAFKLFEEDAE